MFCIVGFFFSEASGDLLLAWSDGSAPTSYARAEPAYRTQPPPSPVRGS